MANAFEGNRGETTTMLPTIRAFMDAHQLADVTVVADAGMISAANQQAIEAAGLSFIMSKHDLRARPIYHHKRESIDAHLTVVFAALAVSRWIEQTTGWSIKKFVRTTRRYRTINIQAGEHTLTAVDPLPDDLRDALTRIHDRGAH